MNFLGDLGGIFEIFTKLISLLLLPTARHSFILKALERMFLAGTGDQKLFTYQKSMK